MVPIGRVLFALIFILGVLGHFSGHAIDAASAHGVPLATLAVPLAGVLACVGGVMVALGYRARFGAFLLACFLVPVTLVMHTFWGIADAQTAALQKAMFMKNLSMFGTCLLIMYYGAGPISLDD